jgi:uncharacterized membrane protein HdeD (DUF308 family)
VGGSALRRIKKIKIEENFMGEHNNSKNGAYRMNMDDAIRKTSNGNKALGVIIAIVMAGFGILLFIWPIRTDVMFAYIATVGFVIYGLYQIIAYARAEARNRLTLASGIIFMIFGILLLFSGELATLEAFIFVLAFLALIGGINRIVSYGALQKMGRPDAGGILAGGIINLILGILFIIMPLASIWMIDVFIGAYLLIGGIALLIEVLSGRR